MVLISKKVDYAILLLCHLLHCEGGASARELADHFRLSRAFIAKILKQLCQENLVESHRGVNGGYRFVGDPRDITLETVISVMDGPFQLIMCSDASAEESVCGLLHRCPVRRPLRIVHQKLLETLSAVTLADIADGDMELVSLESEATRNGYAANLFG